MSIHIVTDSSAHFAHPQLIPQYPVTVVPNRLTIAGQSYREGIDIDANKALSLIMHQVTPPEIVPPTVEEFVAVYSHLAQYNDAIISIHASRAMFDSWKNAREAAEHLRGHIEIAVVDSRTMCGGQGLVVRAAIRAIEAGGNFEDIVQMVRGAADRTYGVYFVETVDYLMRNEILSTSHSLMIAMHDMKPVLTIEEGLMRPMEKVKTRSQAVDRIVEFVTEFDDIEDSLILQHKSYMSDATRMLQDRLAVEFPGKHFPHTIYGSTLAAIIGGDGTGLVLLERDYDSEDDDSD